MNKFASSPHGVPEYSWESRRRPHKTDDTEAFPPELIGQIKYGPRFSRRRPSLRAQFENNRRWCWRNYPSDSLGWCVIILVTDTTSIYIREILTTSVTAHHTETGLPHHPQPGVPYGDDFDAKCIHVCVKRSMVYRSIKNATIVTSEIRHTW